ncbi:hypothetical protein KHA87_13915 [Bacillus sp. FJAT-49736]|nr:hypothetical protein [Bacillus sp. FJAT-49736]
MRIFHKVVDLCWDGLTLKHVSHRGIVIPYVMFLIMAVIFEIFLIALIIFSINLFHVFGYQPDSAYFISIGVLFCMFILTLLVLFTAKKKLFT